MKKALIVGGSNGIGLSIGKNLEEKGYHIIVCDMVEVKENVLKNYTYYPCNLLEFDDTLFDTLSRDYEIEMVMITAGYGRVTPFKYIHPSEIGRMMDVNATAGMKIARYFYHRLNNKKDFYFGIMVSIAAMMSSPLFSVYSASKASLYRFIEAINIELEKDGSTNRILNVSPSSISGTAFIGGNTDLDALKSLSLDIIEHLFNKDELFIPGYEPTLKGVLERYNKDPHEYGLHSYDYKMESGRVVEKPMVKIGYLSGTFDLFHVGHLNLLKRAKSQCDYLIVGVHKDASHKNKETFIPFEERKAIVGACRYVDKVVQSEKEDSDAMFKYHANRLFVGSDYKGTEKFLRYEEMFKDTDIKIIYFPYTQGTSSTQIRKTVMVKSKDLNK